MASKSKSIYCPNYSSSLPFTLSVSFSESSYNVTDNTSSLSLSASIKSGGVSFDTNYNNTLKIYWYDDNANSSGKLVKTLNVQDLSKNATASTSGTLTVTHKADGTLSGYAKAVWTKHSSNSSVGYVPSSGNVSTSNTALTTIPRKSSMSLSASSCYAGNNITISISRASTSFTHKIYYKLGSGSWVLIASDVATSHTWTVPYSFITDTANTSTSCTISVDTYSGSTYIGEVAQSFTVTPYGASTVYSISGSTIGGEMVINLSRENANFTHTVTYEYGSATGTIGTGVGYVTTWETIPMSLCSQTPNSTSGWGCIYVVTYYGSTKIGSTQSKTFTLNVPSSVVPAFSGITLTRVNNGVPSSWGVCVQGYSQVIASISGASGSYGSSISSYYISGGGSSTSSSSMTTGVLTGSGTYTFSGYVKDSRGRQSTSKTNSITVYAYSRPSISVNAQRCTSDGTINSSGTYIKVTCYYNYASVGGKNTVSRSVSCNGASNTSFSSGTSFILNANCSISTLYTLTATVTDGLGNSATATCLIPTAERVFNVKKNGKGWAFGGFATMDNELQVYAYINCTEGFITGTGDYGSYGTWYDGQNITMHLTTTNGWARGLSFNDSNNNTMATIGAYGHGATLDYVYISDDWSNPWLSVTAKGTELSSSYFGALTIHRRSTNFASIKFRNDNGVLGYISLATVNGKIIRSSSDGSLDYEVVDSSGGRVNGDLYVNELIPNYVWCVESNEHNFCAGTNYMFFNYRTISGGTPVNGFRFYNGEGAYGSVAAANFTNTSDRKSKDNIKDIPKAKEFVLGLKPCEYTFKAGESKGKRKHMGFIAQDVSELVHEIGMGDMSIYNATVIKGKDDSGKPIESYFEENIDDENLSWGLNYTEFIAPMVVTIQEQQKQIDELQRQIELLK